MKKTTRRKLFFGLLGFVSVVVVGFLALGLGVGKQTVPMQPVVAKPAAQVARTITYHGEAGKDALTLLEQHASVEQDNSGLVVAINGKKAGDHEYWAFYVNGKLSQVGPGQYVTTNADSIEWKIETY